MISVYLHIINKYQMFVKLVNFENKNFVNLENRSISIFNRNLLREKFFRIEGSRLKIDWPV